MKEKAYPGIDYFRFIAAILVITIHTSPLLSVNEMADFILTGVLARVAVPFFFMATGFFLFSQNRKNPFSYGKFLLKIGKLYGLSILFYLPLNLYTGYFSGRPLIIPLLRDIVFNGTFYHLWYLPAIILGVSVTALLLKYCKIQLALFIAILLYLIGLFGDSYYGITMQIPYLKEFYETLFSFFDYTRNGLFFSPLYLLLGVWLSTRRQKYSFKICIAGFVSSLLLLVAEGLLLNYYSEPKHDSMYLALIPCMVFLFQLLLYQRRGSPKILRSIPLLVYIIHPWCIVLIRGFAKVIKAETLLIENSIIHFTLVTLLSISLSILLLIIWNKKKKPPFQKGRAWAEINFSNLRYNSQQLKKILPQSCAMMAVVKADAYGHGDIQISSELQKIGIDTFAVASLADGVRLRKNGIKGSVLVLGYTYPNEICKLTHYHLIQTVVDYNYAAVLNQLGKKVKVHLKIDTGMHRLGENFNHIDEFIKMFQLKNLIVDGMYTHLCVADSLKEEDVAFTKQQIESFYGVVNQMKKLGYNPPKLHIQSSYGVLNYPELHLSYARIGIALYGTLSHENEHTKVKVNLRPVLSVKARVSIVKELEPHQTIGYGRQFIAGSPMKIATVTIGYADGIPRNLACGHVLIKGKKAPIIGRTCMDQLTIDITDVSEAKQGDIVTLIGQDNEEKITAGQVAKQAETITNELLSRLGGRLERVYK